MIAAHGIDAVPFTVRSVRIWDRQAPLRERVRLAFPGLREEAREYARAWRALDGEDLLIVPGTGLLTDAWGLSRWGPYGLLKWSLMARLRGCRVIFLSVGAAVHGRLGRLLLKSALSLADYRSVPGPSEQRGCGWPRSSYARRPDLSGSRLRLVAPSSPTAAVGRGRLVVGLGLMEYGAKYSVPSPRRHLRSVPRVARRLRRLAARARVRRQAPARRCGHGRDRQLQGGPAKTPRIVRRGTRDRPGGWFDRRTALAARARPTSSSRRGSTMYS